jgi:cysteine desulfurase
MPGKVDSRNTVYLDCNATTPIDRSVMATVVRYLDEEFGNSGSRTHGFGQSANRAVQRAREAVARVVDADPSEVFFTSGATESSNIAILGLSEYATSSRRRHIVSTEIEHKAVLEPIEHLREKGFEITLVPPTAGGWVPAERIRDALRPDTFLVSVMHVNNETGVIQSLVDIANVLADHDAYFHTDASQGFGKELESLRCRRIDLISVSGHKIFGPKGVGALIARRRKFRRPPLTPLMFGGGQERKLRPGTVAVPLVAGLGMAADLALKHHSDRGDACRKFRKQLLNGLDQLTPTIHGAPEHTLSNVVNLSFPGLDAEAVMLALRDLVAISNGSACTSDSIGPSHVLRAMGLSSDDAGSALRWSWCHLTREVDWDKVVVAIKSLR